MGKLYVNWKSLSKYIRDIKSIIFLPHKGKETEFLRSYVA